MADDSARQGLLRWLPIISGQDTTLRARLLRLLLYLLSLFYWMGLVWYSRRWQRPANVVKVPVPVVSVGNLTTGGTGKTPLVQWVCRELRQQGARVSLLSRGYGQLQGGVNDEALELELSLPDVPHLQDRDRTKIAQIAVEELESDCLVLDDGFQHRRLGRDLNLLVIDATCPFGYGYLLPRGLLREPLSAIQRADAVLISRCDLVPNEELARTVAIIRKNLRSPQVPLAETTHAPMALIDTRGGRRDLQQLRQGPIAAFCGVGNPQAFFQTLRRAGAEVVDTRVFADHHAYTQEDMQNLRQWIAAMVADRIQRGELAPVLVVTTRKDLVKLHVAQISGLDLLAIEIQVEFRSEEDRIRELVLQCCRSIS